MGEFRAQPVGKPIACLAADPCAKGWADVADETGKIDAMADVRQRNSAISASYAKLYIAAPELKWAGAAAFASKQVGCGMDTAHTYLDDYPGGIDAATRDLAYADTGVDPVTLTMYDARQTLAAGNLSVYDEIYPSLRFYQKNKATLSHTQIIDCLQHKPGTPVDPDIVRGMQQTLNGQSEAGALTLLKHEQQVTLQTDAYDKSWLFRRSLDVSRYTGYPPITYVVDAACTSKDLSRVVNFKDYPGALYDFDSRWPFARDCANRFVDLSESPASRTAVEGALNQIARGGR